MKIGYLGPEGSYSNLAATAMFPEGELIAYTNFPQVFGSLKNGETDGIVIPVENSLNGGVMQNMDLLQSTDGVSAVREVIIKIDHRLAYRQGADLKKIKRVYSHAQAIEQCSDYLFKNFPSAQLIPAPSTAASLEMVKSNEDACIVGAHTVKEGFTLSRENIADVKNNFTHFLFVVRGAVPDDKPTRRVYFTFTTLNKSGALFEILQIISAHNLNMTKIESRPVKTMADEYRFFIEIEGDYSKKEIKDALFDVKNSSVDFKLLGTY